MIEWLFQMTKAANIPGVLEYTRLMMGHVINNTPFLIIIFVSLSLPLSFFQKSASTLTPPSPPTFLFFGWKNLFENKLVLA